MTTPEITSFSIQTTNDDSIELLWSGTDYSSVNLYYSVTNTYTGTPQTINTDTTTTYTFTGLYSNTLYYFKIVPYSVEDGGGDAGSSSTVYGITTYTPTISTFEAKVPTINSVPLFFTGTYYGVTVEYKETSSIAEYINVGSVIGKSLYNVTGLESNTEYNFQITPFDVNYIYGTESIITNISTDTTPTISTIELGTITATTVELLWTGDTTYITVQLSSDNTTFKDDTVLYYDVSSEMQGNGSCIVVDLEPNTQYYFRVIPYSQNYNVGTVTDVLSTTTLLGLTSVSVYDISTNTMEISWDGEYTYVDIHYSYQGDSTILTITDPENISDTSFVLTELEEYKIYDISLTPYTFVNTNTKVNGTTTLISGIYTDFIPRVDISLIEITDNNVSVIIDRETDNYPPYKNLYIQYSLDFAPIVDYSCITQQPSDDSLPMTIVISPLLADSRYDISFIPTSYYDVSATTQTYTIYTLGNIIPSSFTLSFESVDDNISNIIIDCSGVFTNTIIRYSNTINFDTYTDISRNDGESISYTDGGVTMNFTNKNFATETVYFRIYPVNSNEDIGTSSSILYTPSITEFYMSDVSTNYITFVWNGTFEFVNLQYSTDGENYNDISTNIVDTSYSYTVSSSSSDKEYYRIIPNTSYMDGKKTINIYTPFINNNKIGINSVVDNDISLNWVGNYDYVKIEYSNDSGTTFSDLSIIYEHQSSDSVNTLFIDSTLIADINTDTQTYFFRIIPYYNTDTDVSFSGLVSDLVYNATITDVSINNVTTSPNQLIFNLTGTYEGGFIYHSLTSNISTTSGINFTGNEIDIGGLESNTLHYFKIIPYSNIYLENRSLGIPVEISWNTPAIFDNFSINYNSEQTTGNTIVIEWDFYEYTKIEITPSGGETYIFKTENTDDLSYSVTDLIPNTIYYYTVELTDTLNDSSSIILTTATKPSVDGLNIDYTTSTTTIEIIWDNTTEYYDRIVLSNSVLDISGEFGSELTSDLSWEVSILEPNVTYDFSARLYNALDDYVDVSFSVVTLADISSVVVDTFDTSGATITINGTFTTIGISYETIYLQYTNAESSAGIDISNLTSNTTYTFEFIPYNSVGIENLIDNSFVLITTTSE